MNNNPYDNQNYNRQYTPQQPVQPQQQTAYTWPAQPQIIGQQPASGQQPVPYYTRPTVQPAPRRTRKSSGGKIFLKLLAAVLVCAVVSAGSVGLFAALIQNGTIAIAAPESAQETAAFTLYTKTDSGLSGSSVVTRDSMTPQNVAQTLIPSVVCVQNYQVTQSYSYFFGYSYPSEGGELSPAGEGSGIIISEDGYIVTNQHVVDGATSLKVVTSEGLTYEAELVGEDTQTDLAVIKINAEEPLTPAQFGSSADLQVADAVMAIGNPGGLQFNSSVTMGYISALGREVTNSDTGYSIPCIQTDAAINPGNSGGALVNMDGLVIGINSSKIVATGYEGLGFAIPSDLVQPIVSDLIEFGYVKDRAALGFSGQYIDRLTAGFYGMNAGYYVTRVNSAEAQQAGLQRGDMITAVDGTQIVSASTLTAYLADKKPGDTVTLTVDRSAVGRQGTVQVELVLTENTGVSE